MEMDGFTVEYRERLDRTRLEMEDRNVALLLIYSRGKREMLRMDGVRYLTGYSGLGKDAILIVEKDQSAILIVNPPEISEIAGDEAFSADIVGTDDPVSSLISVLGTRPFSDNQIGFVGQDIMPVGAYKRVLDHFSSKLCVDNDFLRRVGRAKSPWEIQRIRQAQEMADKGFLELIPKVRPGMREFELSAELEYALRMHGSRDNFDLTTSSKHNQAIRLPTERKLENGDIVLAEISPECDGYFAQLCRTIVLGEPSKLLLEKYDLLRRCFDEGLRVAKPGALAEDVAIAMNRITSQAGYETFSRPPYMRSRGHGLGQGSSFPGEFKEGNKVVLEEGMTFVVHPNQYIPETGYMMLGESCEVSENGAKSFSSLERKVFSVDTI